ncbi:MAG: hypothetical protein COU72_02930 [Parcubacteria group bacterium CG10_big_fil_rev_8_21_14_0_10_41_35]|nr:MAG: hypothetical protein COW93_00230 [Parcubacteria group bacterium CG22_combo_CG10-13_8_21_14_all_41_9]PIR57057.1 MAG: hypothetical protein COU72_02930 [Parcubacteria group bacterium CG10_big_fil_rev_8_21_14_0_10_41_35]PIZ81437.1 MAG: hypothetical protein COY02_02045 [Parcubacteria group bacterium CG_4_10_14_0_2_um_filter_41_6]
MKKIIQILVIVLLVLIILILSAGAYIWFKNPLVVKGIVESKIPFIEKPQMDETYDHPLLDTAQETQLRDIGIDPSDLPEEITAEQQECVEEKLGVERIQELMSGQSPSPMDAFKAMQCL